MILSRNIDFNTLVIVVLELTTYTGKRHKLLIRIKSYYQIKKALICKYEKSHKSNFIAKKKESVFY